MRPVNQDRYGRTVAMVTCDGVVVTGAGCKTVSHVLHEVSDAACLQRACRSSKARDAKRGLRRDPEPAPPWTFTLTSNGRSNDRRDVSCLQGLWLGLRRLPGRGVAVQALRRCRRGVFAQSRMLDCVANSQLFISFTFKLLKATVHQLP